jgi:two-component system, OmpR family, phosphate regulon sensor histidine kinase PhoR
MTQTGTPPPIRLLVVDDELGMREGIRRIFAAEGYDVTVAADGGEGIEKGLAGEFDVVLLDLKMPVADGIEVLRVLKQKHPVTEFIMMTAFAGIDSAIDATRAGAYTYLPKPFTPDHILFEVGRAVEKRRLHREALELRAEQEGRLLEIHREQSRLRTIINAIHDAVFVTNRDEAIVLANPRARALFRFPASTAAGTPLASLVPSEVLEHVREGAARLAEGAEMVSREWVMQPPLELVVVMNTVALRDADGSVLGHVTTLQDVTELKRLDQQKSEFVSMVAHELKAPLAAISGYIETMRGALLGDSIAAYATMLGRSADRLRSLVDLINDLLNISRMELGTARREVVRVDVREAVQTAAEFLRQDMDRRHLRYVERIADGVPAVEVDRDEFQRVLTNLLSNAIKYNREGGELRMEARRDGEFLLLTVADSGIGMKPEETAQLFRQFYRAKNEHTRAIPGTGLGLSIVKSLIESYHGHIDVESEYGAGTQFLVRLPAVG